jgi:hypothetical protein
MAIFNLAAALQKAETGGQRPLWRRFPTTARELLQHVFGLCVIIAGISSLVELVRYGDAREAGLFLLVCYLTTGCFPAVYGCYAKNVDGETNSDSLNGRSVTTGRAVFRFMSMWCVIVLLGWAGYFLISLNTVMVGSALMGIFVTVVLVGIINRCYCSQVTLLTDQGISEN